MNENAPDFRHLLESLGADYYAYRHDADGVFTYLSPSVTAMLGYTDAEFKKHYSEFLTGDPANSEVARYTELCLKGERTKPYEVEVRHKNGGTLWLEVAETPVFDPSGTVIALEGLAHNITPRKQAESAQKEALARIQDITGTVPGIIYQYRLRPDGTHCMPYASDAIRELFRISPEEAARDAAKVFDLIHPDDYDACLASIRASAQDLTPWRIEYRIRHDDGTVRWILGSSTPRREADGSTLWHGFLTDITEHKRAEEALRESHLLLDGIINAISVRVFWKNRDLVYLGCNKAFAEDAGFAGEEDIVGKDDFSMGWREQAELYRADDRSVIDSGRAKMLIEEPQTTPDGRSITLLTNKIPLRNAQNEIIGVLGTYVDITAHKQLESSQASIDKLESLGTLAGGIAHDFNNILTAILGNLSLLQEEIKLESAPLELLTEARSACEAAKGLSNQLLTFAKGGSPIVALMDLRPVLKDAAVFAARGTHTRCVFDLGDEPLTVSIDKDQIFRVIQNLVINATQAMPKGGTLMMKAERVALEAGPFIRLTVEDQGPGIKPAHLSTIFDPYFSTKGVGRGLGLAICYSIMSKHGGRISAELKPGAGAVFVLHFPVVAAPHAPLEKAPPALVSGRSKVLLMDDEAVLAKILKRMIEHLGYRADAVKDGAAALDAYGKALKAGKPYATVILDLTIAGGVGGKETLAGLLKLDPTVKAIVTSGYANDPIMADHAAHGFTGVLIKPYTLDHVSQALHRVLGT